MNQEQPPKPKSEKSNVLDGKGRFGVPHKEETVDEYEKRLKGEEGKLGKLPEVSFPTEKDLEEERSGEKVSQEEVDKIAEDYLEGESGTEAAG